MQHTLKRIPPLSTKVKFLFKSLFIIAALIFPMFNSIMSMGWFLFILYLLDVILVLICLKSFLNEVEDIGAMIPGVLVGTSVVLFVYGMIVSILMCIIFQYNDNVLTFISEIFDHHHFVVTIFTLIPGLVFILLCGYKHYLSNITDEKIK
jgi:hypothetical protein